jgi:hypothetical protein
MLLRKNASVSIKYRNCGKRRRTALKQTVPSEENKRNGVQVEEMPNE